MRTTLDLPEKLLADAMRAGHFKTKTATIIHALEDLIRKSHINELKKFKGKVDMDVDLDTLRDRNAWKSS